MQILKNRALVRLDEVSNRSKSGLIILAPEIKQPSYTGEVIAIGPTQFLVKPGDRIVIGHYSGVPVKEVRGQQIEVVVDESEILAVFVDEEIMIERETVAITGLQLMQMLASLCGNELEEGAQVSYVNYSHKNDTLYVTVDKIKELAHA